MRRTDRLFELLQLFRPGKLLRGREIAETLEVSLRTVYRDIDTLIASGVPIEGKRGVGYLLREPIFLPPMTLTAEELRALHLGAEIVRQTGDRDLADGAARLLRKIDGVLPSRVRQAEPLDGLAIYAAIAAQPCEQLATLRRAVAERRVLSVAYRRLDGVLTQRVIHPLQTEYWGHVWTCAAWCGLREDFRVFRVDRFERCTETGDIFELTSGRTYADYLATHQSEGEPS